jgi:hypothetical protein
MGRLIIKEQFVRMLDRQSKKQVNGNKCLIISKARKNMPFQRFFVKRASIWMKPFNQQFMAFCQKKI